VRLVLHASLHLTFCAMLVIAGCIVVFALLVPPITLGRGREIAVKDLSPMQE
jgi:hypothetical protein